MRTYKTRCMYCGTLMPQPRTTRRCPFCAESIRIEACKCKHCGEFVDGTQPASRPGAAPQTIQIFVIDKALIHGANDLSVQGGQPLDADVAGRLPPAAVRAIEANNPALLPPVGGVKALPAPGGAVAAPEATKPTVAPGPARPTLLQRVRGLVAVRRKPAPVTEEPVAAPPPPAPAPAPAPAPPETAPPGEACPGCGGLIEPGDAFCTACGRQVGRLPAAARRRAPMSAWSALSLVTGLLGMVEVPVYGLPFKVPVAPLAILFGMAAIARVRRSRGRLRGALVAVLGLLAGIASLALWYSWRTGTTPA
jgi:hypothetical protein